MWRAEASTSARGPQAPDGGRRGRTGVVVLRFDSYVAVVDAERIVDDLSSTDDLRESWPVVPPGDGHTVADVVVRQIEYADTVVLWENPTLGRYEAAQLSVLLHRLAPWATHISAGASNRVDCTDLAALPHGVVRGRGQLWIASRPETVLGYEYAGGTTTLDDLGYWLTALPEHRWAEATDHRRLTADLDWDPYYGDRRTTLAFIGLDLDTTAITERLSGSLLTDAEIADGEETWRTYPDPFPA